MAEGEDIGRSTYLLGVDPKRAFTLDAHPLTMFHLLDRPEFNDLEVGWWWWDGDTLWHEIKMVYKADPSPPARATLHALKACIMNRAPWNDVWIFSNVVVALAAGVADLERLMRPTPGQLLFALPIMKKIDANEPFDEGVLRFCAACCQDQGVIYAAGPLTDCDPYLEERNDAADRTLASQVYDHLNRGGELALDDDTLGHIAGAKLHAAKVWAEQLDKKRVFDD